MSLYHNLKESFQIVDFSPTHNQVLLRCMRNKARDYNIDIIFKGVEVIMIPSLLSGIDISVIELNSANDFLISKFLFLKNKDFSIFSIKNSKGKEFFINAMCFGVYHNNLDILESSIGRYDFENFGENILWFAE